MIKFLIPLLLICSVALAGEIEIEYQNDPVERPTCHHINITDSKGNLIETTHIDLLNEPISKSDSELIIQVKSEILKSGAKTVEEIKDAVDGKEFVTEGPNISSS